jgi:hypothetical protein
MKSLAASPVIRAIRLVLNVVWYGLLILVIPTVILITSEDGYRPWYFVNIAIDSSRSVGDMTMASTGLPVKYYLHDDHGKPAPNDIRIFVDPPTRSWAIGWSAFAFVGIALWFAEIYLLRKIFTMAKGASPFTRVNARRVRVIGLLIIAAELEDRLLRCVMNSYLDRLVVTKGFWIMKGFSPDFSVLLFGLIVVALAELFRYGVELEEEKALTV